jgi:hypothetical protein
LHLVDKQGRSALTLATYLNFREAALLIIQCPHVFGAIDGISEDETISGLVIAAKLHDKELVMELLPRYDDLNRQTDLSGKGILHHCAMNDWPDVLEKCISRQRKSANINQIDHSGATALHYAASLGNVESIKVLLSHGATVRFQDRNGRTAAHVAADAGFKDALMLLLDAPGLDVNQSDHFGRTLLHWVASVDWPDVMKDALRQPDADLLRRDRYSRTARDMAFLCRCPSVGTFLDGELARRGFAAQVFRDRYDWDSLRDHTVIDLVEDDYYRYDAPLQDRFAKQNNDREREEIRKKYPPELWSMTCDARANHECKEKVKRKRRWLSLRNTET